MHDFFHWLSERFHDVRDALAGSLVYFVYGQVYEKQSLVKGITAFFIGILFAMYLSPEITKMANWNISVVSFLTGFFGMRITEALMDLDIKSMILSKFDTKTTKNKTKKKKENKEK